VTQSLMEVSNRLYLSVGSGQSIRKEINTWTDNHRRQNKPQGVHFTYTNRALISANTQDDLYFLKTTNDFPCISDKLFM